MSEEKELPPYIDGGEELFLQRDFEQNKKPFKFIISIWGGYKAHHYEVTLNDRCSINDVYRACEIGFRITGMRMEP